MLHVTQLYLKDPLQPAPFILTCHMSHTGTELRLLHPALFMLTVTCRWQGEIRWLQPALLPLACSMPHSWISFTAYPVSTGIFNFIYCRTRCAERGNSITLNRKTAIACERNSNWSQSDCIRAVSGSIDAYGLAKPDRWFAFTYFVCLNRPVLPLCPLFARASSFKNFLKSTRVTVNENSAPLFVAPSYLRVLVSM